MQRVRLIEITFAEFLYCCLQSLRTFKVIFCLLQRRRWGWWGRRRLF